MGWGPVLSQIVPSAHRCWNAKHRLLHSKAWSTTLLKHWVDGNPPIWCTQADTVGSVCHSEEQVIQARAQCQTEWMVLKSEFGTAGRQAIRVGQGALSRPHRNWIQRRAFGTQCIVAEPWLERVLDLSVQLKVSQNGRIELLGWNRFWTSANGQYRGHWLGPVHRHFA